MKQNLFVSERSAKMQHDGIVYDFVACSIINLAKINQIGNP